MGPAPPLQLVAVRLFWQATDLLQASVFTSENEVDNGRCLVNTDSVDSESVILPSDDPDESVASGWGTRRNLGRFPRSLAFKLSSSEERTSASTEILGG